MVNTDSYVWSIIHAQNLRIIAKTPLLGVHLLGIESDSREVCVDIWRSYVPSQFRILIDAPSLDINVLPFYGVALQASWY
jgi:hypothetical protein